MQQNYEIYDRELLSIMLALQEFRRYLMNAKEVFKVWTDHSNLQYFRQPQKLNCQQARWFTELQEYHFTIHHLPGKSNSKADILSRRPGFDQGEQDNEDMIVLPPNLFQNLLTLARIHFSESGEAAYDLTTASFQPRIRRVRNNLDKSVQVMLDRKEDGWKTLEDGTCTF